MNTLTDILEADDGASDQMRKHQKVGCEVSGRVGFDFTFVDIDKITYGVEGEEANSKRKGVSPNLNIWEKRKSGKFRKNPR